MAQLAIQYAVKQPAAPDAIKLQCLVENHLSAALHYLRNAACDNEQARRQHLGTALARTRRAMTLLKQARGVQS